MIISLLWNWKSKLVVAVLAIGAASAGSYGVAEDVTPAVVSTPTPAPSPGAALIWGPVPHNNWDAASRATINGKPYFPESAEKPYSIQRALNTTADLTRFELRRGDLWTSALGGNDTERAELDGYPSTFNAGQDYWFAYDLMVEDGPPWIATSGGYPGGPGAWVVLGQVHGAGNAAAVPWGLSALGEVLSVTTQTGATNQVGKVQWRATGKLARKQIYRVVGHLKISGSRTVDSLCEVWLDGQKIVDYTGKIGDTDPKYYFKFGVYRGWATDGLPTMAFQYANVVQGTASLLSRVTSPLPWPAVKG